MNKLDCVKLLLASGHYEYAPGCYCKDGRYTLRHGEYDRPRYRILKHRGLDEYYITVKYSYLPGTFSAPKSGPINDYEMNSFYYAIQMKREE